MAARHYVHMEPRSETAIFRLHPLTLMATSYHQLRPGKDSIWGDLALSHIRTLM